MVRHLTATGRRLPRTRPWMRGLGGMYMELLTTRWMTAVIRRVASRLSMRKRLKANPVKLEVQSTGVTDWLSVHVSSPQSRRLRLTVGTAESRALRTRSVLHTPTNNHMCYCIILLEALLVLSRLYCIRTSNFNRNHIIHLQQFSL